MSSSCSVIKKMGHWDHLMGEQDYTRFVFEMILLVIYYIAIHAGVRAITRSLRPPYLHLWLYKFDSFAKFMLCKYAPIPTKGNKYTTWLLTYGLCRNSFYDVTRGKIILMIASCHSLIEHSQNGWTFTDDNIEFTVFIRFMRGNFAVDFFHFIHLAFICLLSWMPYPTQLSRDLCCCDHITITEESYVRNMYNTCFSHNTPGSIVGWH